MYIGKVAEMTGATHRAIRLYESLGLIPAPHRKGKYRVYSEKDVILIKMIKRAQAVGFNLSELRELVVIKAKHNRFPVDLANQLINKKREKLRRDIDNILSRDKGLQELQKELNRTYR